MANEIRNSANLVIVSGESLQFELPPGGSSNRIWYWRGDDSAYGTRSVVYRGSGVGLGNANNNRQELANLIVNNPSGNNIFNLNGNLIRIELSAGMDSYNYTLRTQARSRN